MDLSLLLLSGLIAAGYYVNKDGKVADEPDRRDVIDESEKPSGDNIYNSTHYLKTRDQEQKLVNASWEASMDPINTNIIPGYYNQLPHQDVINQSVLKQELLNRSNIRNMNDMNTYMQNNVASNINSAINPQNRGSELLVNRNSVFTTPNLSGGWYGISNPDQPLPEPFTNVAQCIPPARWDTNILGVPSQPGTTGLIPQTDTSVEMFDKYGYICPGQNPKMQSKNGYVPTAPNWTTDLRNNGNRKTITSNGNTIEGFNPTISGPQNSFTAPFHNNMVPFYSGRSKQNMDPEANRRKLEAFTGQGDEATQFRFVHKRELDKDDLFKPIYGTTYVYGKPNIDGYGRDRYASNMSQKQNNVGPIESIRVGPGMNYGPGVNGHDGFHPWFRTPQKNVDDLRVNPKLSYAARIIQGSDPVKRRGIYGQTFKNRPDTYWINQGSERFFTTTGQQINERAPQDFKTNLHHTNRVETTTSYAGPAKIAQGDETYATPLHHVPRTQNFLQIAPSNVDAQGQQPVQYDYGRSGYYGRDPSSEVLPGPSGVWARGQERDDTETCRGTIRLNVYDGSGNTRHYDDAAKTTKQQTLASWKRHGIVGTNQVQATTMHAQDEAKTTKIQTLPSWKRHGIVGTNQVQATTLHAQDEAKTTKQETLPSWKRHGIVGTNQVQATTLHAQDEAKTTKIQTLPSWKRHGIVGTNQVQATTMHAQDEAKTTKVETLASWKRHGIVGTGQLSGYTLPCQDEQKTTKVETLPSWKRYGGVGTGQLAEATLPCQDEQKTTKKQITSNRNVNYVGGSGVTQGNNAFVSHEAARNAEIDDRKESTLQGRVPTAQGVKNAVGACDVNMTIKYRDNYDVAERNMTNAGGDRQYNAIKDKYTYGQMGSGLNKLPIHGLRQPDDALVAQFNANPYTHPLSSVAAY